MTGRILFFGDSICAGSDIPDGTADDAWPMLWSRMDPRFSVVNRSRGGRPTASLDEFRDALATAGPVVALVFALGSNDARNLDPGMVAAAVANLGAMVALAATAGIGRTILVGPCNINRERLGPTHPIRHQRDANLRALDAAYVAFTRERGLEYLPLYGVVPEESLTGDGVHPDRAGNLVIARRFAAFIAAR